MVTYKLVWDSDAKMHRVDFSNFAPSIWRRNTTELFDLADAMLTRINAGEQFSKRGFGGCKWCRGPIDPERVICPECVSKRKIA